MVEVQIRTKDMDLTAEKGFAAHWAYKMETQHEGEELEWLNHMVKLQSEISDSKEYLDFLKVDLKPTGMTVFTPKGTSIELPQGSIVLDFAFAVHTELGLHCIGAKINDEVVNLDTVVEHGATIQVLKSPNQEPSPEWLDMVKTVKAKQELRRWMKSSIMKQALDLGKEICKYFGTPTIDDFYERLGQGELPLADIQRFLNGGETTTKESNSLRFFPMFNKDAKVEHRDEMPLQIGQETSLVVHFAKCCSPVPGDPIVGVLRPKIGIEVHNTDCPQLKNLPMEQRIAVEWSEDIKHSFEAHLTIETENSSARTCSSKESPRQASIIQAALGSCSRLSARNRSIPLSPPSRTLTA